MMEQGAIASCACAKAVLRISRRVADTVASIKNKTGVADLSRLLQALFRQQAREVASRLTLDGPEPDLTGWIAVTANAVKPLLLRLTQAGIVESKLRIARKLGRQPSRPPNPLTDAVAGSADDMRRYVLPASDVFGKAARFAVQKAARYYAKAADARVDFDLFNPRVLDAVDAASFRFCRETMDTATTDLGRALRDLRRLLRHGMERGEALRLLAKKVRQIFADPARAFRIAVTEASRAQHAGQLMAARESGVVRGKSWVASSDACEHCLSMEELGTIPLDRPFWVDPRGGPYAVVMAPPLHPHCFCAMNEEIE